jgi:hypothetical protein
LRAARALWDNEIEDEDEIIPTLVFAANLGEAPRLERIRDGLTKAAKGSKDRVELNVQLYDCFGGLSVTSMRVVDGVPVVREAPFRIIGFSGESYVEEVAIDVFKRSAEGEEIREWYEWYLKRENLEYGLNRGEFAYKFDISADRVAYKGHNEFLRILARPEERSVDPDGYIFPIIAGGRKFPPPEVIAGVYTALQGSQAEDGFAGFDSVLPGKRGGRTFETRNLVPACVAWYVGGRRALTNLERGSPVRPRVAKILNEGLLKPCGKDLLPDRGSGSTIWRNTETVNPAISRLERAIRGESSG